MDIPASDCFHTRGLLKTSKISKKHTKIFHVQVSKHALLIARGGSHSWLCSYDRGNHPPQVDSQYGDHTHCLTTYLRRGTSFLRVQFGSFVIEVNGKDVGVMKS